MTSGMRTELLGPLLDVNDTRTAVLPLRRRIIDEGLNSSNLSLPEHSSTPTDPYVQSSNLLDGDICATPEDEIEADFPSPSIEVQTRITSMYRNLGSEDDAPRSVAICPQRKCVAFGCRLGIELHWVDALTGGDLNRWFPLSAPSDHLYFLPYRPSDSPKKLRLISSAAAPQSAGPGSRAGSLPAKFKERALTHDRGRRQSMTRLFFGNLPFPGSWANTLFSSTNSDDDRHGVLRTVDCDHFQAIPLADGSHMLYIDAISGLLCIGNDGHLGSATKLNRKVVLASNVDAECGSPYCFNATRQTVFGLNIVAAHRSGQIVLYHIPSDVWDLISGARPHSNDLWNENAGVLAQSDLLMDDMLSQQAHPNTSVDPAGGNEAASSAESSSATQRPVHIAGAGIANVGHEIVDSLLINGVNGGLVVWAFCRSGMAKAYNIYGDKIHCRDVHEDGMLYEKAAEKRKGKERAQ